MEQGNILRGGRVKSEGTKEAFKGNHWIFSRPENMKIGWPISFRGSVNPRVDFDPTYPTYND